MLSYKNKPLVLMILDGWGYSHVTPHNAIAHAHTPQWDTWWQSSPHMLLDASGTGVGLPDGQMGNSEVGHMHIGAGRVIPQDFTRINQAIQKGEFAKNIVLISTIQKLKHTGKALHVMGLLSPGGVHSHENHLFAFLDLCQQQQFAHIYLHLFLDGRDTPPQSALPSLRKLQEYLHHHPVAKLSSLTGRYYAMDRDQRWERLEPFYQLVAEGLSNFCFETAEEAVQFFYQKNISDEFIPPTKIGNKTHILQDEDAVFCFNFRADRVRQLTSSLITTDFLGFQRIIHPRLSAFISMTTYAKNLATQSVFPLEEIKNTLGEVLAKHGLSQLRIAETEKYAHVTFFFNGGIEPPFPHEDRILIPSPQIATYDLKPTMSAPEITQMIVEAIQKQTYDVIICNYANADMVGHTGNFSATVQAIECLDQCMHRIGEALRMTGGQLLITADHGNAEKMYDELTQQSHTAHTHQPVPLLYVGTPGKIFKTLRGSLIDIAPTVLSLLRLEIPLEMEGQILLADQHAT